MNKLSIIIPCFNSEKTLEEAVNSCFKQGVHPLEIIMVDDGSTDKTKEVIKSLGELHPEIKYFSHSENKGGGAARNTAIKNSTGDAIFCLDSDDILPPNTLHKMHKLMMKNNYDGVGVHKSIKFKGTDIKNIHHLGIFSYVNERIPFDSLFEKNRMLCSLYSTFMFTKKAFETCGGYPTDHGFDTQGFAWRFLANGLDACTCPDTEYLHRVQYKKSYYIREYENGKVNYNWFSIFDEFLYFFNDLTKECILSFNLSDFKRNLFDVVREQKNILSLEYKSFLSPNTRDKYTEKLKRMDQNSMNKYSNYWLGSEYVRNKKYVEALPYLYKSISQGGKWPIVYEKIFIAKMAFSGKGISEIMQEVDKSRKYTLYGSKAGIWTRIKRKIWKNYS